MEKQAWPAPSIEEIDRQRIYYGITKAALCARADVSVTSYYRHLANGGKGRFPEVGNRLLRALEQMIAERSAS